MLSVLKINSIYVHHSRQFQALISLRFYREASWGIFHTLRRGRTMVVGVRRRYVPEFEQLGADQVRARLRASVWDEDKASNARRWLDNQLYGEERARRRRAECRAYIALGVTIAALLISVYVALLK